jgi:hypothetical protein
MEYQESYQGRRVRVKTMQRRTGSWTAEAEIVDEGQDVPIAEGDDGTYGSEDEARRAALSAAAAAIDRARAGRGKP